MNVSSPPVLSPRLRAVLVTGVFLLALTWLFLTPVTSRAATVAVGADGPEFAAAKGETNALTANAAGETFTFTDTGAIVTAGAGCVSLDPHRARCLSSAGRMSVGLNDGADTASASGAAAELRGGLGNDLLRGGAFADELQGNDGDDRLIGAKGPDILNGGLGIDTADYSDRGTGVMVTLNALADDGNSADGPPGARDKVRENVENVTGSGGSDRLTGNGRDNVLRGAGGRDTLRGLDGDDDLFGDGENDQLNGGEGGDDMRGGAGKDTAGYRDHSPGVTVSLDDVRDDGNAGDGATRDNARADIEGIVGTTGDDVLIGNTAANTLVGEGGGDELSGAGNPDELRGGPGPDEMQGGTGFDTADYGQRSSAIDVRIDDAANDGGPEDGAADNVRTDVEEVIGGAGADRLSAVNLTGGRTLRGQGGEDTLLGSADRDTLEGGDGNDRIEDGALGDFSSGGAGNDVLLSQGGADEMDGGDGNDELTAMPVPDFNGETMNGGPGNDTLTGGRHNDDLDGGPGDDWLGGGDRFDELSGGDGNDTLRDTGGGNDVLRGNSGDDDLESGYGAESISGGAGFDTVRYSNGLELGVIVTIGPGTPPDGNNWDCSHGDGQECGHSDDFDLRADNIQDTERLITTPFADDVTGDDLANVLVGRDGADRLSGLGGDDRIEARDGFQDEIVCGPGVDTVIADEVDDVDAASCEVVELP